MDNRLWPIDGRGAVLPQDQQGRVIAFEFEGRPQGTTVQQLADIEFRRLMRRSQQSHP